MKKTSLALVLGALLLGGCYSVDDIRLPPLERSPRFIHPPLLGPVQVSRVELTDFSFAPNPTPGLLSFGDFFFLLGNPGRDDFDALAAGEIAATTSRMTPLEQYWSTSIEERLKASNLFAGEGAPVEVRVWLARVEVYHPKWSLFFMTLGAIGTPFWTLGGPPSFDTRVLIDATFAVRSGSFEKEYHYPYHIGHMVGLLYNRDHQIGPCLGELTDRLAAELRRDLDGR